MLAAAFPSRPPVRSGIGSEWQLPPGFQSGVTAAHVCCTCSLHGKIRPAAEAAGVAAGLVGLNESNP